MHKIIVQGITEGKDQVYTVLWWCKTLKRGGYSVNINNSCIAVYRFDMKRAKQISVCTIFVKDHKNRSFPITVPAKLEVRWCNIY